MFKAIVVLFSCIHLHAAVEEDVFTQNGKAYLKALKDVSRAMATYQEGFAEANKSMTTFSKCLGGTHANFQAVQDCYREGVRLSQILKFQGRDLDNVINQITALYGYQSSSTLKGQVEKLKAQKSSLEANAESVNKTMDKLSRDLLKILSRKVTDGYNAEYIRQVNRNDCELFKTTHKLHLVKWSSSFENAHRNNDLFAMKLALRILRGLKNIAILRAEACEINVRPLTDQISQTFDKLSVRFERLDKQKAVASLCARISDEAKKELKRNCEQIPITESFEYWLHLRSKG